MLRNVITGVATIAALISLAGCADDPQPASTASSSEAPASATSTPHGTPATPSGVGSPTKTVTAPGQVTPTKPNPGTPAAGSWDRNGNPVNGGPKGADGSTGNNLSKKYCAQNQDPACPVGSFVGPNAILSPDGSGDYSPCEGTICTNPNHGAGDSPTQNGGAPTTATKPAPTTTEQRDDDPGGSPCTTGMGVPGVYVPDSNGGWVCQIG